MLRRRQLHRLDDEPQLLAATGQHQVAAALREQREIRLAIWGHVKPLLIEAILGKGKRPYLVEEALDFRAKGVDFSDLLHVYFHQRQMQ